MMTIRKIFSAVVPIVLIFGGYLVVSNQQDIRDWWYLRSYEPSAEVVALATNAGMSSRGTNYFYVSDPQLNDKLEFNDNCPFEEQTIVLGCYNGKNIFILDIDAPELDGIETVTAAHEMLHAVYQRLSSGDKEKVNLMVNQQFEQTDNPRIKQLIAEYDQNDQALINNELHSILPTELAELTPELDAYYDDLFDDRQKVVAAAKKYEAVFISLNDKLDSLQSQLDSYQSQIKAYESSLESKATQIQQGRAELDRLDQSDDIEGYNSRVPIFNSLVRDYNSTIEQLRTVVEQHNAVVEQVNATAVKHNDLVNTIDSDYQEL